MKRKFAIIGVDAVKKIMSFIILILMLMLVHRAGECGLHADFVEQDAWHIISAKEVSEGIMVETAGENLVLHSGVKVSADSMENSDFCADMVRDGVKDDSGLRWSSENDWDNNEHWLEVSFPKEETVGLIRIYWERTNACLYAIEYSDNHKDWLTAAEFSECPKEKMQDIYLSEPVSARYLRLHVTDVTKDESDLSLYYQNVSVLEMEVYEGIEDIFTVGRPDIPAVRRRQLVESKEYIEESYRAYITPVLYPKVPEEYSLKFIGADYDTLIAADGKIADNIADSVAEIGFELEKAGVGFELPGMKVEIPTAQENEAVRTKKEVLPEGYTVSEWSARGGTYSLNRIKRIVVSKEHEDELNRVASLFARELSKLQGYEVEVAIEDDRDGYCEIGSDDVYLSFIQDFDNKDEEIPWIDGMGEEGYEIWLQNDASCGTRIVGATAQGIRWGCVSMISLLEKTKGVDIPVGILRDYPKYSVRGFGIDVGRRSVPLEMLYDIVREMSKYKMNTLTVHLNDNDIIAQSDYDKTVEGARSLYAGFRLESDIKNEKGEGITSSDSYYTKEEFMQFIEDAAVYGVNVVPEIDTPAHSLFITKVFPNLGLSKKPESVDQLDLSKMQTGELVKSLWSEYLDNETGASVFGECDAVHIGMDEYYGDEKEYIDYLTDISKHIGTVAPDKKIRMWGSLSQIRAENVEKLNHIQMHIWNTDWADPYEMYEEGFYVINSLSSNLYIIPGGGYDRLDMEFLEEKWQPNIFETNERTWILPAYSPKMLGASYMMWNDLYKLNKDSITDEELFERFAAPLPVIAHKLW